MTPLSAQLQSLLLSRVQDIAATGTDEWWDKPWRTSFHKQPAIGSLWLGYEGFREDEQADRRVHGGVDRAVCVYAAEHYPGWRSTLGLPDLPHGAFGENLTTQGLVESGLCIGDVFTLGEARVQVSQPRQPCWKLARRWRIKDLTAQVERTGLTGWYFRVLQHGMVSAEDSLALVDRPCPEWTIERCNEVMYRRKDDPAAARELAGCALLAGSWKDELWSRARSAVVVKV